MSQDAEAGGRAVLVVEDDPLVLLTVRYTLEAAGYRVVSATSLEEAVARWSQEGAGLGLVLSDLALGQASGVELAGPLRPKGLATPVVFMSGLRAQDVERHTGLAAGGVLRKPFSREELLDRVAGALAR
ncbi:MAG: response regulator [Planctomycetota bacterium]